LKLIIRSGNRPLNLFYRVPIRVCVAGI